MYAGTEEALYTEYSLNKKLGLNTVKRKNKIWLIWLDHKRTELGLNQVKLHAKLNKTGLLGQF